MVVATRLRISILKRPGSHRLYKAADEVRLSSPAVACGTPSPQSDLRFI